MPADTSASDWQLATNQPDPTTLEIAFSGRWCLDQQLPTPDEFAAGLDR